MTRRDYKIIAEAIRQFGGERDMLIAHLETIFQMNNSHFDANKFRKACGQ